MASTTLEASKLVRELEPEDWRVLHALERSLDRAESLLVEQVSAVSGLHMDEASYRLKRLNSLGLVVRRGLGYSLIYIGLDVIALGALAKRGFLAGLGRQIGVGKESDVYEALREGGEPSALKFFRIGRVSFRDARRKRSYTKPEKHHHWLLVSIKAAEREFWALRRLYSIGVAVPEAVARERHAVLMSLLEGPRLVELKELDSPESTLLSILEGLRRAYVEAGVVNADLSEYNVLYDGSKPWIIDWPQAVPRSHPNSLNLLERDVGNILRFFNKRFGVECELKASLLYVTGSVSEPPKPRLRRVW